MAGSVSPRILYLEDNEDMRYYVPRLLKASGYEVVLAENLVEGLRLAKTRDYDLYLLDYILPDGTGIELCRLIRTFDTSTPILFYSSNINQEVKDAALSSGAQLYIDKNEALENLERTLSQFIVKRADSEAQELNADRSNAVNKAQQEFNDLVKRYNADFRFLLVRASTGEYDCLLTSFLVLRDLYRAIMKLHEASSLEFRVIPYPLTLRGNDELLSELGFTESDFDNINGFLRSTRESQGREFEALLEEGLPILCGSRPIHTTAG